MRQATYIEPGKVECVDVPPPALRGPDDAIVRPVAVSTCDLDVALVRGLTPFEGPFPLGHECIAIVAEVGDEVVSVRPGDLVCVPYQVSCGTCRPCRDGRTGHCTGHGGRTAPAYFGAVYGFGPAAREWGGFLSDLVRVPFADHMLFPLAADVDPVAIASLSDNVIDGWRTVGPAIAAQGPARVLVVGGSGSIGLYAVLFAVALGSEDVVYVDGSPARLQTAAMLGAAAYSREQLMSAGVGPFPITVDASGGSRAGLRLAVDATAPNGTCTSTGIHWKPGEVPLTDMYFKGMTLTTGLIHARAWMPSAMKVVSDKDVDLSRVVDRTVRWDDSAVELSDVSEKLVFSRPIASLQPAAN